MVHVDIKPDNILYSPGWRKIVLIDFGLATFIEQRVDESTETHFMGTPRFAGEEMKYLHDYKRSGLVNLYKNDYEMLIKTAEELFYLQPSNFLKSTPRT